MLKLNIQVVFTIMSTLLLFLLYKAKHYTLHYTGQLSKFPYNLCGKWVKSTMVSKCVGWPYGHFVILKVKLNQ